ncbi:Hypothetical_protein [Hexamita inflata]|uniref:Hypothetical_protein n=1 Tax=Hexamita inflata TaxID=28002 RepID=A0AA86UHY7_9EUKA|nr:Hypothetical protein HINF_LOCUS44114 [Hexamita inflata]
MTISLNIQPLCEEETLKKIYQYNTVKLHSRIEQNRIIFQYQKKDVRQIKYQESILFFSLSHVPSLQFSTVTLSQQCLLRKVQNFIVLALSDIQVVFIGPYIYRRNQSANDSVRALLGLY